MSPRLQRPGGARLTRRIAPRPLRVALVGADGAGKSTVTAMLEHATLPFPVKRIYMGVNLEASTLMLPTTRLLLAIKRARGHRPDMVAGPTVERSTGPAPGPAGWRSGAKETVRLSVWMLEEWLRQLVALAYSSRGYLVVFDRHFYADYYFSDVAGRSARRSPIATLHGWMLAHAYPKPDLVICLDAPADVLFARKPEATREWLEQRRRQYLALSDVVPAFVVVDVDRPLSQVYSDVLDSIRAQWKAVAA